MKKLDFNEMESLIGGLDLDCIWAMSDHMSFYEAYILCGLADEYEITA
ncbi:hypothetical protein [Pedobacter gandavensis]|uniref:Bacteriocin n=1 Tax=Pedobacter gandavensis TaxID=2679963 RepID=A0ABR6ESS2_9SPHI|nr:hypothetical protein [Pedobacter gandavensis]MBB2148320.1 hypothetical protein [Pedobacter gandavensis]